MKPATRSTREYSHSFLVTVPPDVPYPGDGSGLHPVRRRAELPHGQKHELCAEKWPGPVLADPAGSILNWQVESLPEWLSIDTSQGSLIAGQETALTLVADTTGKGQWPLQRAGGPDLRARPRIRPMWWMSCSRCRTPPSRLRTRAAHPPTPIPSRTSPRATWSPGFGTSGTGQPVPSKTPRTPMSGTGPTMLGLTTTTSTGLTGHHLHPGSCGE